MEEFLANTKGYRFGFQGQEHDDEINGDGNSYAFEYRIHDPRIGRFLSIDPLAAKYPFYAPYVFSGNRVIDCSELEGLEPKKEAQFYLWDDWSCDEIENILEEKVNALDASKKIKEKLLDDVDDAEDGLWWFRVFQKDWAARNLTKYLMGVGGVDIYSFKELSNYDHFNKLLEKTNIDIVSQIKSAAVLLKNGETMTLKISQAHATQGQKASSEGEAGEGTNDFALAFGATEMAAMGTFTISKDANGNLSYSGTAFYSFMDKYDWGPARRNTELKQMMGVADHWQMMNLKNIGAADFWSRSYFSGFISGTGTSFNVINYQDTYNPSFQQDSEQDNLTIPEGTPITYDGRQ